MPAAQDRRRVPRGRRPALRALWSGALVLALAVGVPALERTGLVDGTGVASAEPRHYPTPGFESAGAPLGRPDPVASPSASWSAEERGADGEPARWDPCRPVHHVVNPAGMPPGGEEVLASALERVSRATGLRFVLDGTTDETDRATPYDPQRWGDRWAPALLRWDLSEERAVWLHELAHTVGLGHVEDAEQLMNPELTEVAGFAAGDLTGLAALGTGPCLGEV
ncbi:hypothetical protein MO973_37820 [Paenibacillus sp. TRM 82003]|uniref:hypothetical protein n=1 Tax=Kineococcus sp. TRM81007 TaxID=2925831 RepID=UPI001F572B5B|nr:hypothetical protein [Kineococcus sp. TRM81007]MCI2237948.1 hypothetical protein [Kineococcus sp. TRM81007]MCI3925963.1 hypothetical protein [Paenibacillus sp. TRM 82003]